MSAVKQRYPISVEDYLASELVSPIKHEYIDGYVYAMSGARNVHNDIAVNIVSGLHFQLRGKPCKPCNSDTKVRIPRPTKERFFYPDAFVVCKPSPPELSYQERPVVSFEVISESTRRTDEWEKKEGYLALPSLCVCLRTTIGSNSHPTIHRRIASRCVNGRVSTHDERKKLAIRKYSGAPSASTVAANAAAVTIWQSFCLLPAIRARGRFRLHLALRNLRANSLVLSREWCSPDS